VVTDHDDARAGSRRFPDDDETWEINRVTESTPVQPTASARP
jgi:hypothetical protein